MMRYPGHIDGESGTCGVTFPDLPGIVAMGTSMNEAMISAVKAQRDYALEAEREGAPNCPNGRITTRLRRGDISELH